MSGAVIAAAVIGAGASLYAADQQSKAQDKANKRREQLAQMEKDRLAAIEADVKPTEEGATVEFGQEDSGDGAGGYDDFMVKKSGASKLGAAGGSGLGGGIASSLGMGA